MKSFTNFLIHFCLDIKQVWSNLWRVTILSLIILMDGIHTLHWRYINHGGSYIDSLEWVRRKKPTINPETYDKNCFQYATTTALNHESIGKNHQRTSKKRQFINQYDWKEINFSSEAKDWKKFERNSKSDALNVLFSPNN